MNSNKMNVYVCNNQKTADLIISQIEYLNKGHGSRLYFKFCY